MYGLSRRDAVLELAEVFSIGLPYCCFKILAGLSFGGLWGGFLVGLGGLDAVINGANALSLLAKRERVIDACFFGFCTRLFRGGEAVRTWQDFGNSLDVLLCCSLVVYMIARGGLSGLSERQVALWNICVILNVAAAGLSRFGRSVRSLAAS